MKSIVSITLFSSVFIGCKENKNMMLAAKENGTTKVKKQVSTAHLQTAHFSIEGMSCAIGCAKTIERELNGLEGVQSASIDFEKKSAVVSFDNTILKSKNICDVVENAGNGKKYKVLNMKL